MVLIDRLREEHKLLVSMMDELQHLQNGERNSHDYHASFQRIIAHEGAEDETIYNAMSDHPELVEVAGKALYQEQEIRRAIEALNTLTADNIQWDQKLNELAGMIRTHVRTEEDEVFPQALEVMGAGELDSMEEQFVSAEKMLQRPPSRVLNRV